ncbi:hypothetical protein BDV28DRAFT_66706 [Aspergillus coremiiformis]|uniref:Uncharacterized protein n=1 Tax=Aspergillus coremiiformis TaxID=138285 RepID=A0A5N6YUS9_9EURO|nr:hypothetical protein BDV28DRAFT_66706 [Aspergillus coremiiformis]
MYEPLGWFFIPDLPAGNSTSYPSSSCVSIHSPRFSLSNNVMALWMASRGYTTIQQNNYPTGIYATAILRTTLYSILSDKLQSRWECSIAIGLTFITGSAILVSNPSPDAAHFLAFYLLGTTYAPPPSPLVLLDGRHNKPRPATPRHHNRIHELLRLRLRHLVAITLLPRHRRPPFRKRLHRQPSNRLADPPLHRPRSTPRQKGYTAWRYWEDSPRKSTMCTILQSQVKIP